MTNEGAANDPGEKKKKKRISKRPTGTFADDMSSYCLWAPKCLCVITHWPFYRGLRSFLQQLYRIYLSPSPVPLERYIAYLVNYLPLPPPGVHSLNIHLDLGINDPVELSSLKPIVLRLPDARSLPLMDLDYDAPFRALSIDNVIKVFTLMLVEERLLFVSSSTSLLTEIMETLLTLLFPLRWLSCYIPRLPDKLHEILDAPGSFLLGIHLEGTTAGWTLPPLSDGIFVVDLDANRITDAEGKSDYMALTEELEVMEALKEKLRAEMARAGVSVLNAEQLRERDLAFELPGAPGSDLEVDERKLDPEVIREAFLVFMCDFLGSYTAFFNSQERSETDEDMHGGVFQAFDVQAFTGSLDKTVKPLMEKVVPTQMFAALLQQRTENSQGIDRLVFFETCVTELNDRRREAEMRKKNQVPVLLALSLSPQLC
jgi:hypothetical protein